MKKFNFIQPEFLLCEIPIKNNTQNDNRIWVYHRLTLSLIEFVNVDDFVDFKFEGIFDRFEYVINDSEVENYFGVFVQNNCEATENNKTEVLKKACLFLQKYLIWEDKKIENNSN